MENTLSEGQTREEIGNGRDEGGGGGRRLASTSDDAAEKSGAIRVPRGGGVADSRTSDFAPTAAAEGAATLPSSPDGAIDIQQQQQQQRTAAASPGGAVEAAAATEARGGGGGEGGGGGGGARAGVASTPDLDRTAATTSTTTTTTTTAASGGGGRSATNAPPPHVAAHAQGDARSAGDSSSSGNNNGAHTAAGGGGASSSHHREPSHTNVPAHQQQPPLVTVPATILPVPAPPTQGRAMVPDKEDDDDDPAGGASSQRQHTLQNYASRDSGAVMLENSPASKGMANLLVDSKDKYAISPCEDKQWAVLGLSEDILVRTIRISSHEKYSSLVKDFQVLASQSYPVNEWLDLGTFTAKFVQGEQTFDLPDPAFARYLKFKFLSHYGDEFYCTVSQVKVHGATMLESFQDEWQQSSADVREVQDYIKKKDPKPSATGIGGNNGSVSQYGGGAPGTNGGHRGSAGGGRVPQSQAAASSETVPASTPPASDGGVEHRPHAASAATVPPNGGGGGGSGASGGVGGGGGGGAAGAGTATVEDIVRGVPAEMVVPASTMCSGPTGTDGSCPGEVLTDRAGSGGAGGGATAAGGGGSTSLGAEIPTMGGGGDTGKPTHAAGGGGGVGMAGGAGGDGGGMGQGADSLGHPIGGGEATGAGGETEGLGSGQQEPGAANSNGGSAGNGKVGQQLGQGLADGSTGLPVDGSGAPDRTEGSGAAGEGVGSADVSNQMPSEGGEGEKQKEEAPPRKGIISSTMEAISKAVNRGDPKDGKKPSGAAAGSGEPGGVTAPPGGAVEGQAVGGAGVAIPLPPPPPPPPPTAPSPDVGSGMGGDGTIGGGVDVRVGANLGATGYAAEEGAAAVGAAAGDGSSRPPAAGQPDGSTSEGRGSSDPEAGDPVGGVTGGAGQGASTAGEGELREGYTGNDRPGGSGGDAWREPAPGRIPQTGHGDGVADSGATGGSNAGSHGAPASTRSEPTAGDPRAQAGAGGGWDGSDRPGLNAGLPLGGDGTQTTEGAGHTGAGTAFQEPADVNDRLQHAEWTLEEEGAGAGGVPPVVVVSETGEIVSSHGGVPPAGQGGAYAGSTEGAWHAEGANADEVALVAACMDRLSFADFRDEVLTRTQQAQQSPGGGVAIGGQYESIFKTLMNKIKTLEINQSLFSLYIDDVHVCYQEVIAQMLREQERARASRSELLSTQAAHFVQIGDQWPEFQELQAKMSEVENRMLLSSMAWFTSLFCLVVLVCNCFFKLLRRCVQGPRPSRDRWGGGGRRGRRFERDDWTHRCTNCTAATCSNGTPSPGSMGREWRQGGGMGGRDEYDGSASYAEDDGGGGGDTPRRRLSNWVAPERGQEGDAMFSSSGSSRF